MGRWFQNDLLRNLERTNVAQIVPHVENSMRSPMAYYHIS